MRLISQLSIDASLYHSSAEAWVKDSCLAVHYAHNTRSSVVVNGTMTICFNPGTIIILCGPRAARSRKPFTSTWRCRSRFRKCSSIRTTEAGMKLSIGLVWKIAAIALRISIRICFGSVRLDRGLSNCFKFVALEFRCGFRGSGGEDSIDQDFFTEAVVVLLFAIEGTSLSTTTTPTHNVVFIIFPNNFCKSHSTSPIASRNVIRILIALGVCISAAHTRRPCTVCLRCKEDAVSSVAVRILDLSIGHRPRRCVINRHSQRKSTHFCIVSSCDRLKIGL
mmetsp:Transcript_15440/g.39332  ORF Transcript_15440/g.39332 Transcript_15440/m.39332 type:complete len:279 (+) Transcript_15440:168-1004(+)